MEDTYYLHLQKKHKLQYIVRLKKQYSVITISTNNLLNGYKKKQIQKVRQKRILCYLI